MLTRAELRKLAKAARELASEYAEERGPEVSNANGWCGCAAAQVVRRAFGFSAWEMAEDPARWGMASGIDIDAILTGATDRAGYMPGAVVFPLLWLADELDAQQ